jgi:hypothetical protein
MPCIMRVYTRIIRTLAPGRDLKAGRADVIGQQLEEVTD